MNALGKERRPFCFVIDYKAKNVEITPLEDLDSADISISIDKNRAEKKHNHSFAFRAVSLESYAQKFEQVIEKIEAGETYILNLTQATPIESTLSLKEIYHLANAPYKLRYKDEFVCFSPEAFVHIEADTINTYPMKGTINAAVPNARETILANTKELAEHVMIVDLLRNDLSMVSKDVRVEKFRYVEKFAAGERELLQVSSHISGTLDPSWHENIGDIFQKLLPAGSITGAPKRSTVSIIDAIEGYERGFFTGVFGLYDGKSLQSAVMIRFVEKTQQGYIYKSGGGITLESDLALEYAEYQEKIYLP